ncbi:MAG: hypothetical protein HYT87_01605 [Nitrospirae bacterium]|nr:hypothetical protein [Nitrospirota bacterium]
MARVRRYLPWLIGLFWLAFYLTYPYRELVDDSQHRGILENRYFAIFDELKYSRPLHALLLHAQGHFLSKAMDKAMLVSMILHLLIALIAWRVVIPRMPERMHSWARFGLTAFMLHPIALQTTVHVSQRVELLGTFFVALSLAVFFRARSRTTPLPSSAPPTHHSPLTTHHFFWLTLCALGALASKENYVLIPFALTLALAIRAKSNAGAIAAGVMVAFIVLGSYLNTFSHEEIRSEDNYSRSRAFRQAVLDGREVTNEESIFLPLRSPVENLKLQVALVPLILRIVFVPFGLTKDYGHFPYGRQTYSPDLPWLWIGLAILIGITALIFVKRKAATFEQWVLILSPAVLYSAYVVFVVYDPLFLYRLYGVSFLTFVVALPTLAGILVDVKKIGLERAEKIAAGLAGICVLGGVVRFYEMKNPIAETAIDLRRRPDNFRLYVSHMRKLVESGKRPVDCGAELAPALKYAPSSSHVYVQWAWCLKQQGKIEEAQTYAMKSLEQQTGFIEAQTALGYLSEPPFPKIDIDRVHPMNKAYLAPTPIQDAAGAPRPQSPPPGDGRSTFWSPSPPTGQGVTSGAARPLDEQSKMFIDLYEQGLTRDPGNMKIREKYAEFLAGRGDWSKALEHYRILLDKDPTNADLKKRVQEAELRAGSPASGTAPSK